MPDREPPPLKQRTTWWWSIYLLGSVGFWIAQISNALTAPYPFSLGSFIGLTIGAILSVFLLPFGIVVDYGSIIDRVPPGAEPSLAHAFSSVPGIALGCILVPTAYLMYLFHYRLTRKAATRRIFLLLMLGLILLVSGSLVGCVKLVQTPLGLQ